jgi:hypothetical protein
MRYVLFRTKGAAADAALNVGVELGDGGDVADISAAFAASGKTVHSMRTFLELGAEGRAVAESAAGNASLIRKRDTVELRAPIYDR